MKRLLGLALLFTAVLALSCAPALAAEGSFDRTLQVSGAVMMHLKTGSGTIIVRPGSGNTVHVHARIVSHGWLGLGGGEDRVAELQKNPPVEQTGNIIRIGYLHDEDMFDNVSIDYTVETPADTTLESSTGSGSQQISGLKGAVRLHSGSGTIRVSNLGAELTAETGSGGVEATDIAGPMTLSAGSGHIRASQTAPGSVSARTGSGGITLEHVKGSLRVSSGSGHITISGEPSSYWRIHTGSGGMDLMLPSGTNFDLDARTGSGGINTDFPVTMQGSFDRRHVRGRVGNGGPNLDLESGSGGIRITKSGTI